MQIGSKDWVKHHHFQLLSSNISFRDTWHLSSWSPIGKDDVKISPPPVCQYASLGTQTDTQGRCHASTTQVSYTTPYRYWIGWQMFTLKILLWLSHPLDGTNHRWVNSVLTTEYEYEYYSAFRKWANTNTNNIRSSKNDRIRIRIIFGLPKMTEYEYE